jgi:hypothetical protein
MDVRLSAPDLFVERSVRSAWRTAEGVGDLLMTDAADRQVLLGRWSQSRRVDAAGWGKSRIATVKRPLNHLRALQTRNFVPLCGTGQGKTVNKELLVFSGLELIKTQFNRFNRTSGRF